MVDKNLELFDCGHRACGGCGAALAARLVTKAAGTNTIVVSATGCMEVFSTPYPETAWKVPGSTPYLKTHRPSHQESKPPLKNKAGMKK